MSEQEYRCVNADCRKIITSKSAYISKSINNFDGQMIWCKNCVNDLYRDYWHKYSDVRKAIFNTCLRVDVPFTEKAYGMMLTQLKEKDYAAEKSFSIYMQKVFSGLAYENGVDTFDNGIRNIETPYFEDKEIPPTLEAKYGAGYKPEEYEAFEKKWNKLIDNYGSKTSFHNENLITYIRLRVKEELATARGDIKESKDWGALADKAAVAAKINVNQLTKSDISGGVELIPQLFEAVESEVGIIPILPQLKEQPYDDADLIIWSVLNYGRRLEDKSRIAYRDIWNFYDEMIEEHFKQKGFSEDEIEKEKQKRNNVFRDLSTVYREPVYEESDL